MTPTKSARQPSTTKKSRQPRATAVQMNYLVQYMEEHRAFAAGKFLGPQGNRGRDERWSELAEELNKRGAAKKTAESWKNTWRDTKCNISRRWVALKKEMGATGNRTVILSRLTDLDRRVVAIIGPEYIDGTTCLESFPEGENAFQRLAAEEDFGEDAELRRSSVEVMNKEAPDDDFNSTFPQSTEIVERPPQVIEVVTVDADRPQDGDILSVSASTPEPASCPIIRGSNTRIQGSRRVVCERLGNQLQEARTAMTRIAEKHADAMQSLADSMKIMSQAAQQNAAAQLMLGRAALLASENETKRTEALDRNTEVMKSLLDYLSNENYKYVDSWLSK